ncbi:MAG: sugar phosphate isomerase/epimerase family protein [bacterium]
MKIATWISVSDLVPIPQTNFEKIIQIFDKKTKFFRSLSLDFIFSSLKQAGVDGLELLIPKHTSDNDICKVRKILDKYRFPVLSIHQSLSNKKPFSLKEVEKLCRFADYFSSSVIVLHSTTLGNSLKDKSFINSLKILQKQYKIKFGIENMSRFCFGSKTFTHDAKEFSQTISDTGLYITFDTTHMGQAGGDIVEFYLSNKERIINIHISDYKNTWINKNVIPQIYSHLPLGQGELPLEKFLRIIKKEKYNSFITMEINSKLNDICDCARFIKSLYYG